MKIKKLSNRGMTGQTEAGLVIGLIMVAIVLGTMLSAFDGNIAGTTSNPIISLTGQGNTTYYLIRTIGWVALTLDAIGILAIVGKWIMTVFA